MRKPERISLDGYPGVGELAGLEVFELPCREMLSLVDTGSLTGGLSGLGGATGATSGGMTSQYAPIVQGS